MVQLTFDVNDETPENPDFINDQLLTYLGNKRSLLRPIDAVIHEVRSKLSGRKLKTADVFSGSGVISRLLKQHSSHVIANDLEPYAACMARAYLTNEPEIDRSLLIERIDALNAIVKTGGPKGFISRLYAPSDDSNIQPGERVFYTSDNARRLDAYAQLIPEEDASIRDLLYASLLSNASIHANTGGVFKGFYKDKDTGLGRFGGSGENALSRITSPINLKPPQLSRFLTTSQVFQLDAADLPDKIEEIDFAYLDPPYNQHPYGSNYFMLNLLLDYQEPSGISKVSGIPDDWKRSAYNKKSSAMEALQNLVLRLPAKFVLLSFSDDGFIAPNEIIDFMSALGNCSVFGHDYNTYRASRNLSGRSLTITEHLFLLEKR